MHIRASLLWRMVFVGAVMALLSQPLLQAQGFKWWQDEAFQQKLALSPDQSKRIEDAFQGSLPELRRVKHQLDALEGELARLMETPADEAAVAQKVDRVEAVRAELNKTRTLMLLRIRRILTADQRSRLDALHKTREYADRGKRDDRPR